MKPKIQKPACPKCRHKGYTQKPAAGDQRPEFTCTACGNVWTCGHSGGIYAKARP